MSTAMRVLVVDDSAYNRKVISEVLNSLEGVEVVGKASDGNEALQYVARLKPDLITLDLEMPRMDGFTFLRLLMARRPTPVIVVSGYAAKENVFRALELGAVDFVAKPTRSITGDLPLIRAELAEKVALVRHLSPPSVRTARPSLMPRAISTGTPQPREEAARRLVVIGASTGGPTALVRLFRRLPAELPCAFVVAQHMPARFTRTFAERLGRISGLSVREVQEAETLRTGEAWICPGGQCVEIGIDATVVVKAPSADDRYVPSANRLFRTASKKFGRRCLAVVLTGMGDDGAEGAETVVSRGGHVVVESRESAAIFGMPGAVLRNQPKADQLTIPQIAAKIRRFASGGDAVR
ncbi:MAG: chemotaxis-specific protein-glutamate methyltransferase CheB [Myxococcota bacterium]